MTIAKDFAAKFAVAFVAVAMIFMSVAPAAKAETTEDLQKMINDLLKQVAALQSQTGQGGTSVASGICPYTWTRDLTKGATGDDVMKLQKFLNADEDTRVAAAGVGSVGAETTTFGPATAAAVSKFQVKYRAETLSPANLVNPTGYFGPASRAKANALCSSASTGTTTDETDEDTDTTDEDTDLSGEADLDNFEINDAEDTDVEEGDEDIEIGQVIVEFTDGDAEISRIDLALDGGGTNRPWKAFDSVSLWVDGDKIAEADAGSKSDYLGNEADGVLRFSDLNLVAKEGTEVEISVAATIQDNLDAGELGSWSLTGDSLRFFDADGVATTESDTTITSQSTDFNIAVAGDGEELKFSLGSSNPDASDILVDTDKTTKDETILAYKIKAVDNEIDLTTLAVKLTTSDVIGDVISDIKLVVDGQTFNDEATLLAGTLASTSVTYAFDIDGDVVVGADEEVDVEVVVDFKRQDTNYSNGATIKAEAIVASTVAEGADDLAAGQLKGSAVGKTHTLVATGVTLEVNSVNAKATTANTAADSFGEYTINFDVTAVDETAFVALTAERTSGTSSAIFQIEDANGNATTTGTVTQSLSRKSGGTVSSGYVEIADGETATFELVVTYNPTVAGQYRVQLLDLGYTTVQGGSVVARASAIPVDDFETSSTLVTN